MSKQRVADINGGGRGVENKTGTNKRAFLQIDGSAASEIQSISAQM